MKMKKLLTAILFFVIGTNTTFAAGCPDGSEPVKFKSSGSNFYTLKCTKNNSSELKKLNNKKVSENDITFPSNFYTDKIKSCKAVHSIAFDNSFTVNFAKRLIGYDWHADHSARSNSVHVRHQKLTEPLNIFMASTHNAIVNNVRLEIDIAKDILVELAKADTLYNSIGYIDVIKKPACYAGKGDINAPCWYHEYQYASNVFSNYMITALWLKDELSEQELKTVNKYIEKMYEKFLRPTELHKEEQGFYGAANGGISILAYASWIDDKKLAAEEINHRYNEIDRLFYEDGYINNNSFRGQKAQYYHSFGVNTALSYVYLAELFGVEIPKKIYNKLKNASNVVNLAITDYDKFTSRPFNEKNTNITKDPLYASKYTNPDAIGLDILMLRISGVTLEKDAEYLQKRGRFGKSYGMDFFVGYPTRCIKNL